MKNKATSTESGAQSNVSDWMRELWEVEAQHTAMVGSRLKFWLPLPAAPKTKRRKTKAGTQAAVKA